MGQRGQFVMEKGGVRLGGADLRERDGALIRDSDNGHVGHPACSQHGQASLIILPSPGEASDSFSQQPGQGVTGRRMDLASEMNLFAMPGLEHILEG